MNSLTLASKLLLVSSLLTGCASPTTKFLRHAQEGRIDEVQAMLDSGTDVNSTHFGMGYSALSLASQGGQEEMVRTLLKAGANPNIVGRKGLTALTMGAASGNSEIVKLLLEASADVNMKTSDGATPLIYAVTKGPLESVTLLLKAGADPNIAMPNGITPLHIAAETGHAQMVKTLLKDGADPNMQWHENGALPIHQAALYGHVEVTKDLLDAGTFLDAKNSENYTPMLIAARYGHDDLVIELVNRGANVRITNNEGWTALHMACRYCKKGDTISMLLNAGADVHGRTLKYRATPLHLAAANTTYYKNLSKILIAAGADEYARDYKNKSVEFYYFAPISKDQRGTGNNTGNEAMFYAGVAVLHGMLY